MKIGNKINTYFLITYLLISITTFYIIGQISNQVFLNDAYQKIETVNNIRAEHISTYLKSEKEVILVLAASTVFRDFLKLSPNDSKYQDEKFRSSQRLDRSIASVEQINELFIIDKNGKVVVSTNPAQEESDKTNDPYFIEGKKNGYITDFYFSKVILKNTYAVSAPIKDDQTNELIGVVVARMNPETLYGITESSISLGTTGENFLINKDKYLISPSRFLGYDAILTKKIETQNADECFRSNNKNHVAKNYLDYRNTKIIGAHSFIPEANWCILTKIDRSEIIAPSYQLLYVYIISAITSLIIFFMVSRLISKSITMPIVTLLSGIEKIKQGNYDLNLNNTSKDEIGDLSRSFDLMTKTVKKSREEIEIKVKEQTKEIVEKSQHLQEQRYAMLNILEDTENLARDLEKFKLAVDNVSDQVIITDPDGIVLYGNPALEIITGYKVEEAIGKKAAALWQKPMDKSYYNQLWNTIKTEKSTFIGTITNVRKNKEEYQAFIGISPILNKQGDVMFFVGVERDITKEKEIDKAKTEFISLASHQLRTPLTTINWYVEMLLAGDAGPITDEQKKFLEEASNGSKRMVKLVNALLNVSRIEAGTYMVNPEPVDVVRIVCSVLDEEKPKIDEKKLQIIFENQEIPIISLDPNLTTIIFQNLITNAVKYSNENGLVTIHLKLIQPCQLTSAISIDVDSLLIQVSDVGIGIPKNQQSKIFTKLFRAENVQKTDAQGTGLGLYLIKGLIEKSKGKIWFESEEGKGTTFYVTLPLSGMEKKEGSKKLDL